MRTSDAGRARVWTPAQAHRRLSAHRACQGHALDSAQRGCYVTSDRHHVQPPQAVRLPSTELQIAHPRAGPQLMVS